jgi:hypothetical protein
MITPIVTETRRHGQPPRRRDTRGTHDRLAELAEHPYLVRPADDKIRTAKWGAHHAANRS